jgi:hypothetical protein
MLGNGKLGKNRKNMERKLNIIRDVRLNLLESVRDVPANSHAVPAFRVCHLRRPDWLRFIFFRILSY